MLTGFLSFLNRIQHIIQKRLKIRITSFWPAVVALVVATFLFCLPGQEFPHVNWLDKIHFDKFAHIGLFSIMVFLWILPRESRINDKQMVMRIYLLIALAFVLYGICIEFIQLNFVPNRSFDVFDIVADAIGCAFGSVAAKTNASVLPGNVLIPRGASNNVWYSQC